MMTQARLRKFRTQAERATDVVLERLVMLALLAGMTIGVWVWAGVPQGVIKAISEVAIFGALGVCILTERIYLRSILLLMPLLIVGAMGAGTALLQSEGATGALLFLRELLKCTPLLVVAYAFRSGLTLRHIGVLLLAIVFIQFPTVVAKLLVIGVDEKFWVGTLHQEAGELGALFPLLLVPLVVALSLYWRWEAIWLLALLSFFAVVNEKRVAVLAIPLMSLGTWGLIVLGQDLLWRRKLPALSTSRARWLTMPGLVVISTLSFYFGTTTIPSLNPGDVAGGGRFDTDYIAQYMKEYLSRGYQSKLNNPVDRVETDASIQLGRLELIRQTMVRVAAQPIQVALFGFGGSTTNSSYLLGEKRHDILFQRHGLRGAVSYAGRLLIETGYLGLLIMAGWFGWLGAIMLAKMRDPDPLVAIAAVVALGMHIVAAFDFFIYSNAFWTMGVLTPVYFLTVGLISIDRSTLSQLLREALRVKPAFPPS